MSWLVGELWMWMALSGALGFLSTILVSTRRVALQRVVEVPVEPVAPVEEAVVVSDEPVADAAPVEESPFPVLPGSFSDRPWEAEEEWSRPAKRAAAFVPSSSATSASSSATAGDDWDDAAASWRDWADEATGRRQPSDGGTAARDASPAAHAAPDFGGASPFPPGAIDTPFRYDDSPFPYAQPVEAVPGGAERQRLEGERVERERFEAERVERERLEAERLERERLERERLMAERLEQQRLEAERLEQERLDAERAEELPLPSAPYGPGSAYAPFDGSAPFGFPVKGHESTRLFHTQRSRFYSRIQADVWFDSEDSAVEAGFRRWDQRLTTAHHVRHPAAD